MPCGGGTGHRRRSPAAMGRFWATAAVVLVAALALPLLPFAYSAHVTGVRVLHAQPWR